MPSGSANSPRSAVRVEDFATRPCWTTWGSRTPRAHRPLPWRPTWPALGPGSGAGTSMVFLYRRPILDEWAERGDVHARGAGVSLLIHEIGTTSACRTPDRGDPSRRRSVRRPRTAQARVCRLPRQAPRWPPRRRIQAFREPRKARKTRKRFVHEPHEPACRIEGACAGDSAPRAFVFSCFRGRTRSWFVTQNTWLPAFRGRSGSLPLARREHLGNTGRPWRSRQPSSLRRPGDHRPGHPGRRRACCTAWAMRRCE